MRKFYPEDKNVNKKVNKDKSQEEKILRETSAVINLTKKNPSPSAVINLTKKNPFPYFYDSVIKASKPISFFL